MQRYMVVVIAAVSAFTDAAILSAQLPAAYYKCLKLSPRQKNGLLTWNAKQLHTACQYSAITKTQVQELVIDPEHFLYIKSTVEKILADTSGIKRVRKEYRIMTDNEREVFHRAFTKLKNNGLLKAYGEYHSQHLFANFGPLFLGWHRLYLLLFEQLLVSQEPDVILPYWASFWDNEMDDPVKSIIWDSKFAGTALGAITEGVQANWTFMGAQLIRNMGDAGQMISKKIIDTILSRDRLAEINYPFANSIYGHIERVHTLPHMYLGGSMSNPTHALADIIFSLHHGLIDCIWENFRQNQIKKGINPETDWPPIFTPDTSPNSINMFFNVSVTLINLSNDSFSRVIYEPNCKNLLFCNDSVKCPSKYLECNVERSICVPIKIKQPESPCCSQSNGYAFNNKKSASILYKDKRQGPYLGIQNSNCGNLQQCDSKFTAYVPILITTFRSNNRPTYNSFRVKNGVIQKSFDVYKNKFPRFGKLYEDSFSTQSQAYEDCRCRSTTGAVTVITLGISYISHDRVYQPLDQRSPVSSQVHFAHIKNPKYGKSEAYIMVVDECARECIPLCRVNQTSTFRRCNGVVNLSHEGDTPTSYGESYGEATHLLHDYTRLPNERYVSKFDTSKISLVYDCDFRFSWPFALHQSQEYDLTGYIGDLSYKLPPYITLY